MNGNIELFLQTTHQLKGHIGLEQTRHILNGDRIGTHGFNLLRQFHPCIHIMNGADRIGNRALGMLAHFAHGLDGCLQIAGIIHRIKHPEHIDAINRSPLDKLFHNIVGIVAITQNILTAKQHLLRGIGHGLFQCANTLPGILAQIADTGIKGGPSPGFQRPKTYLVQLFCDGQHIVQAQPGSKQGLVGIA